MRFLIFPFQSIFTPKHLSMKKLTLAAALGILLFSCNNADKERNRKISASLIEFLTQRIPKNQLTHIDSIRLLMIDSMNELQENTLYVSFLNERLKQLDNNMMKTADDMKLNFRLASLSNSNEELKTYINKYAADTLAWRKGITEIVYNKSMLDSFNAKLTTADTNHFSTFLVTYIAYFHGAGTIDSSKLRSTVSKDFKGKYMLTNYDE